MTRGMRDQMIQEVGTADKDSGLFEYWRDVIAAASYDFQPIVNMHTGVCYGLEAFLRRCDQSGFASAAELLDHAERDGVLLMVERMLIAKAIDRFKSFALPPALHLFCNLDHRALLLAEGLPEMILGLCWEKGISPGLLCLEISEAAADILPDLRLRCAELRTSGLAIALDDFGSGYCGLQLIYDVAPRFLKIDDHFVRQLTGDPRRKTFVAGLIGVAHQIGVMMIAEGVETEAEYLACLEVGCDLAQGRFIQEPTADLRRLVERYEAVEALAERQRRGDASKKGALSSHLIDLPTVAVDADLVTAVELFRKHPDYAFLPVVDAAGEPVGIIRERRLKSLLFTQYGWHLMRNAHYRRRIGDLVEPCPAIDIHCPLDQLITSYAADSGEEGLIIIKDMRYAGFLSSRALLRVVAAAELATARDQSPLTRLPGNNMIYGFVSRALAHPEDAFAMAYFDFDHFKPFNDKFGFRQGDRAIMLFADLLRANLPSEASFIGHVGGDDFFAGYHGATVVAAADLTRSLIAKFEDGIRAFYDEKSRTAGFLDSVDRDGAPRRYPLMTVSAVLLRLPAGRGLVSMDDVVTAIADAKKIAKLAPDHLFVIDRAGPQAKTI